MKRRKEEKGDKMKIGEGTSVAVKVREIDEKVREGIIRRIRKDLVSLYYLAHINYVLFL